MKTKKIWHEPQIIEVKLDNEISILMTSTPPGDPFKSTSNVSGETRQTDPYA